MNEYALSKLVMATRKPSAVDTGVSKVGTSPSSAATTAMSCDTDLKPGEE